MKESRSFENLKLKGRKGSEGRRYRIKTPERTEKKVLSGFEKEEKRVYSGALTERSGRVGKNSSCLNKREEFYCEETLKKSFLREKLLRKCQKSMEKTRTRGCYTPRINSNSRKIFEKVS